MSISEVVLDPAPAPDEGDGPVEVKRMWEQVTLALFLAVPFIALIAAVPLLWGWGLTWRDVVIAAVMYAVTGHGVTVGFHRMFTHHAFRAQRWLRVTLAVAGMMSIQGPVTASTTASRIATATRTRPGATGRASGR
jgi:stearoyl-CoA desaturase (delta-9 desaturase)